MAPVLKARVLTALVLAPLVVAAIYLAPLWLYAVVFGLITAAAAWEWAALVGCATIAARAVYTLSYAALAAVIFAVPALWVPLLIGAVVFWMYALYRVLAFDPAAAGGQFRPADALYGLLAIGGAYAALIVLRALPDGANWVMLALASVWLADVGAYFAGKQFGRRKLLAKVSPGKSWEGVLGGMLAVLLVVVAVLVLRGEAQIARWLPVLAVLVLVSVLGDLFESTLKRRAGVKDSGRLLPGHGGMLDRIDAQLSCLPLWGLWVSWTLGRLG